MRRSVSPEIGTSSASPQEKGTTMPTIANAFSSNDLSIAAGHIQRHTFTPLQAAHDIIAAYDIQATRDEQRELAAYLKALATK